MTTLNTFLRALKLMAIAFAFSIFIMANATPAFAFGSSKTSPQEGEASLNQIREKSEQVSDSQPRSLKEVQSVAKGGLNGVQGSADKEKMIQPEDAPEASTVRDDIESGIKSILGQD
ncbi:hypothetical protein [Lyngbya confervoides]|uniref:Low temperature-induced protein n=1 Tax=Lyngbya confervoides BDU141951 TaxID=1574623 RepID=A0ABD4SYZ0_9CYAN|nr:hypothetical protein [Lyngbya confervoides]MCM1981692.1 hypothetical protein [Lyngbya confervoides BDU141951]